MAELSIKEEQIGDVVVFRMKGRISIGEGSVTLRDAVHNALSAGHKKYVWDFSEVLYVDSSGIGELVSSYTVITRGGGNVVLYLLTLNLDLVQFVKLATVFDVYENIDEALSRLSDAHLYFLCPVDGCRKVLPLNPPRHFSITCSGCGAQFDLEFTAPMQCKARSFHIPAYPGEYIKVRLGTTTTVEIGDRLDLFVSEAVRTARNVIPLPRRIIFDISEVSDVSLPGLNALYQLCVDDVENSTAVIFRGESVEPLAFSSVPVYQDRNAALAVLSETIEQVAETMTVKLFETE